MLAAAFFVLVLLALRWSRVRPVQRDERGDAPLLIIDGKVYDADRNPYPLLDVSGSRPQIPALISPELQAPTTARDQMIDLATRGALDAPSAERRRTAAEQVSVQAAPQLTLLPPEQAQPWVQDVLPGIVRDAIEVDVLDPEEGTLR
jgi:hypothetical protein